VALNTKNQSNHLNREEKIVTFPPTGYHYHSVVFGSSNLNADQASTDQTSPFYHRNLSGNLD